MDSDSHGCIMPISQSHRCEKQGKCCYGQFCLECTAADKSLMEFRKSMGMTAAPTAFPTKITRKEPLSKKALEEEWAFYKEYRTKIPTNAPTHQGKLLKEFDEITHTASPTKSPTALAVQLTPLPTTVTSVPTFKPTIFPTPRPTSSPTQIWVAPAIPHFSQHCDAVKLVGLHAGTKFQVTDPKTHFLS